MGARRVLALIHWQALKLWIKRAAYRTRPVALLGALTECAARGLAAFILFSAVLDALSKDAVGVLVAARAARPAATLQTLMSHSPRTFATHQPRRLLSSARRN